MKPSKPYLIRAIYEWLSDNNCENINILVDTSSKNVLVPNNYVNDNRIVLNISNLATENLIINNNAILFKATFNGISHNIYIPISSVLSIFSPENNCGMNFDFETMNTEDEETNTTENQYLKNKKTNFTIIKGGKDQK